MNIYQIRNEEISGKILMSKVDEIGKILLENLLIYEHRAVSVMFLSLLWFYKNECKAQSNCTHDPTFRHSNIVSSLESRLEYRNVGS